MSIGPRAYQFEKQLAQSSRQQRRDRGVFYTPWIVAKQLVAQADQILKQQLNLPMGLADVTTWATFLSNNSVELPAEQFSLDDPFVQILEPSAGSGVFVVAILDRIYGNILGAAKSKRYGHTDWHRFLSEQLPGRFHAIELIPDATEELVESVESFLSSTGVNRLGIDPVEILTGNSLEPEIHHRLGSAATVVLGNPPYAAASQNNGNWIKQLLRGRTPESDSLRSYFEVSGQPLQEKKLWLHDDYVKFLRVAQWHLERSRYGIIGLVMNHGFLDNVTFRGLRYQLLDQFDSIEILDLNGNTKKRGTASQLTRDESVFNIGQGVALSLFARTPTSRKPSIQFGELWGPRDQKLQKLEELSWQELAKETVVPSAPYYFLTPRSDGTSAEYHQGILITDLMPQSTSAVVTARDAIVIDTSRSRLLSRIQELRDGNISDSTIRRKYFPKPRSSKYLPGDTRSWKLPDARQQLREDTDWEDRIEACNYRPFDRRWIYWSPGMVDWPRGEVMESMRTEKSLGLIVRRQMPPDRPCNHFFVADSLVVDGILRSDNRGNETLLPLMMGRTENLNRDLLPNHLNRVASRQVFDYIYALFYCEEYRSRFSSALQIAFPRVFFPETKEAFDTLSALGHQLVDLHLARNTAAVSPDDVSSSAVIAPGHPKFRDGFVWIDRNTPLAKVDSSAWGFHFGSHQVLRKWLKDRRGSKLSSSAVHHYYQLIEIVKRTQSLMIEISDCIKKLGGFHRAMGFKLSDNVKR